MKPAGRMRRTIFRGIALASVGAAIACGMVAGIDDYEIGDCKGGVCVPDASEPDTAAEPDTGVLAPVDTGVPCPGRPAPPWGRRRSRQSTRR